MSPQIEAILRAAGEAADDAVDLGMTALALAAAELPDLALEPYQAHLERLARELAGRAAEQPAVGEEPALQARLLAEVLAGEFGYDGDRVRYDDPANANLVRVIDRRRGLPVSLGILYIHAGRANGWRISGVNFPGHFLVRLNGEIAGGPEPVFIDPFTAGRTVDARELEMLFARIRQAQPGAPGDAAGAATLAQACRPVPARAVLLRLQNNLYARARQTGRMEEAAGVLARMTLIAPREASLWLERGDVEARLGRLMTARAAYGRAAELALAADRFDLARKARAAADGLRRSLH